MARNDSNVYTFSNKLQRLIQTEINEPVFDSQTDQDVYFGFPFSEIIRVLSKGLADFDKPYDHREYGRLTPEQQVALYCFIQMKRHLFAAIANFHNNKGVLKGLFKSDNSPVVIDVGCGPATAALGLCEALPGKTWAYFGIDRSEAMKNKARQLHANAVNAGLIGENSQAVLGSQLPDPGKHFPGRTHYLIIFSYFFGSPFLKDVHVQDLARYVNAVLHLEDTEQVLIAYTNSTRQIANNKYNSFLRHLGMDVSSVVPPKRATIEFKTSQSGPPKSDTFLGEVYELVD